MKIFSLIHTILDRLFVVVGALLGSQIPEFIQQYKQRLAGHVDELHRLSTRLTTFAFQSTQTIEQYIQRFLGSHDPDLAKQGLFMDEMVTRSKDLSGALDHLNQASLWSQPYVFIRDFQFDIAEGTWRSFSPGINFSIEGICYAVIGMILGWSCYHFLVWVPSWIWKKIR